MEKIEWHDAGDMSVAVHKGWVMCITIRVVDYSYQLRIGREGSSSYEVYSNLSSIQVAKEREKKEIEFYS